MFVTDYNNDRITKIEAAGIITTVAGGGTTPIGYVWDDESWVYSKVTNTTAAVLFEKYTGIVS